jgi:glutamate-1-semialdehyde 2,1-aminomutase
MTEATNSLGSHVAKQASLRIADFISDNPASKRFHDDVYPALPGGTTRAILAHTPFPITFSGGRDAYLTPLDGHEYLDFVSEYCAGMFGHSHPQITEAI